MSGTPPQAKVLTAHLPPELEGCEILGYARLHELAHRVEALRHAVATFLLREALREANAPPEDTRWRLANQAPALGRAALGYGESPRPEGAIRT